MSAPAEPVGSVLVLWVGYRPGPWTVRSLERAGYRVVRAHPRGARDGRALGRPAPLPYPPPREDPDGFATTVESICADERFDCVLPVDEDIVRLLADRAPDLGGAVVAGPSREQYRALCDKAALGATARAVGVDHPETIEVGTDGAMGDGPPLPSIVKPSISGSHGVSSRPKLVGSAAERSRAVATLHAAGIPALVQPFLEGPRWVGHCVRSVDDFQFVGFRVHRDHPRGDGPASVMSAADVPAPVVDGTRRLLEAVQYVGPCSLSFIEQSGRFMVHDVNLRLGATVAASVRSGFDLPRKSVEAALGRDIGPPPDPGRLLYVSLEGELRELLARRRGTRGAEGRLEIARRIAAGILPGRVLDPSPLDPSWLVQRARGIARRAARDPVTATVARAPAGVAPRQ